MEVAAALRRAPMLFMVVRTLAKRVAARADRRWRGYPGGATRTRAREFLVNPDDFKRLGTGEAVVINPTAKPPADIVRVWPPREGM